MNEFFEFMIVGFVIVSTFMILSALLTPVIGSIVAFAVAVKMLNL